MPPIELRNSVLAPVTITGLHVCMGVCLRMCACMLRACVHACVRVNIAKESIILSKYYLFPSFPSLFSFLLFSFLLFSILHSHSPPIPHLLPHIIIIIVIITIIIINYYYYIILIIILNGIGRPLQENRHNVASVNIEKSDSIS